MSNTTGSNERHKIVDLQPGDVVTYESFFVEESLYDISDLTISSIEMDKNSGKLLVSFEEAVPSKTVPSYFMVDVLLKKDTGISRDLHRFSSTEFEITFHSDIPDMLE